MFQNDNTRVSQPGHVIAGLITRVARVSVPSRGQTASLHASYLLATTQPGHIRIPFTSQTRSYHHQASSSLDNVSLFILMFGLENSLWMMWTTRSSPLPSLLTLPNHFIHSQTFLILQVGFLHRIELVLLSDRDDNH